MSVKSTSKPNTVQRYFPKHLVGVILFRYSSPLLCQVPPTREEPLYQSFDHLMKEFHVQQEMESTVRVRPEVFVMSTSENTVDIP